MSAASPKRKRYYVRSTPEAPERGPYTEGSIRESVAAKRLRRTALVREEDGQDVTPLVALLERSATRSVSSGDAAKAAPIVIAGLETGPIHRWGSTVMIVIGLAGFAAIYWMYVEGTGSFMPAGRVLIIVPLGFILRFFLRKPRAPR